MSNLNSAANVANVSEIAKCCKIEGCNGIGQYDKIKNKHYFIKGYCAEHYSSLYKHGDPLYAAFLKNAKKEKLLNQSCKIEGCKGLGSFDKKKNKFYFNKGLCRNHYRNFYTYGNALEKRILVGENRMKNPLYAIYCGLKGRCHNPNNEKYKNYGARSIQVCETWLGLDGFSVFCNDMKERPSLKHSLERKNVNLGYNKDNCTWAIANQQAANKTNSNKTVGVAFDKFRNKWIAYLVVDKVTVFRKRFKTEQAAQVARLFAEIKHFGLPIKHL